MCVCDCERFSNGLNIATNEFLTSSRILLFLPCSEYSIFSLHLTLPSIFLSISFCLFVLLFVHICDVVCVGFSLSLSVFIFHFLQFHAIILLTTMPLLFMRSCLSMVCVRIFLGTRHTFLSLACFYHAWMAFLRLYLHSSWVDKRWTHCRSGSVRIDGVYERTRSKGVGSLYKDWLCTQWVNHSLFNIAY